MMKSEKCAADWQSIVDKKDKEIIKLRRQVDRLTEQFRLLQAQRFGASREKLVATVLDQFSLFNEAEVAANPAEPQPIIAETPPKRQKSKGKRVLDLDSFPAEQIVHELPPEACICTDCGGQLHACGHDVLRREVTYVPAQYKVTEHVQTAYSCRHCEQTSDHISMKKSPVPTPVIRGSGVASPSLIAQVLHQKYTLHLPLHRQAQELMRLGIPIPKATLSNWVLYVHEQYFVPLFAVLHEVLLGHDHLHADETSLQVLREDGRRGEQKSYLWLYRTSRDSVTPVVVADYQPSRSADCAGTFLQGFSGMLHTDGYEAYHCKKIPVEITVVGCWAHMRRKFFDAIKVLPAEVRHKVPAQIGLKFCDRLFDYERFCEEKRMSPEERFHFRQRRSRRLAKAFFRWAKRAQEKNPAPKSLIGVALGYAINQESWLMNVFLDGQNELSNNRAERTIRPFAVGRKNWLFCNTPRGARASATIYSLVETAKSNGLNPFLYLKFLLEQLPQGIPVDQCLPWLPLPQERCR